ncbi:MAG TPA: hypothetical protein VHE35_17800 [Kofleriaceae bacterium]|nr:hypothetical protein [Kofleriaceae bacterium]
MVTGGRQRLAYAMSFAAAEELAMVLPLPVVVGAGEADVRFVDLSGYRTFFADLEAGFPLVMLPAAKGGLPLRGGFPAQPRLQVYEVGDFEASFVPTPADFARLDPRFRLPEQVLTDLTSYRDWGFAVVQLRRSMRGLWGWLKRKKQTMQPLALEFPTRDAERLFFPTLHVHDGEVHAQAAFDHTLYWQLPAGAPPPRSTTGPLLALGTPVDTSPPAGGFIDLARARDLVDGDAPCHRRVLHGLLPNQDTWIELAPRRGAAAA